jgi:SAM-dependent methyltransferase
MSDKQVIPAAPDSALLREFWNRWFAEIPENEFLDPTKIRHGEVVVQLLQSLNLSKPDILEVGCVNGWLCAALAQFGQVTGIDLADKEIAKAKIRYPQLKFIAGDFLTAELPPEHFDVVVSVAVISVFEDQRRFLDRVSELLKSRGYLLLMCPHRFVWERTDFIRRSHGEIPLNWLNMGELKRLLRDRFSVLHSETIIPAGNRGILRLINSWRLSALIQKVVPEPYMVTLKEKVGLGKTLVVVAQKRGV